MTQTQREHMWRIYNAPFERSCIMTKRECHNMQYDKCDGRNMIIINDIKQHVCKHCGKTGLNVYNTAGDVRPMMRISKLDGYVDKSQRKPPFMGTIYGEFVTSHYECKQCQ